VGTKIRLQDTKVKVDRVLFTDRLGKRAIIVDDEIATGGTMVEMCETLHTQHGIQEITLACTHGLFAGKAVERINKIPYVTGVVCTDTVYSPHASGLHNLHVETVAPVFAEAIRCNHLGQSVGGLFAFWPVDSKDEDERD
jgi:ribose-phosphate pyrophosphokinase